MSCSCCLEQYSSICNSIDTHTPMIIPCGHSICKNCLYSLHNPECPSCRQKFYASISTFKCNYAVMEIVRAQSNGTATPKAADGGPPTYIQSGQALASREVQCTAPTSTTLSPATLLMPCSPPCPSAGEHPIPRHPAALARRPTCTCTGTGTHPFAASEHRSGRSVNNGAKGICNTRTHRGSVRLRELRSGRVPHV